METRTFISEELAQAALAAIKEQWKDWLAGIDEPGDMGPGPVLVMGWCDSGDPAIVWEEGPFEWALLVNAGGASDEDRALAAAAAKEFGVPYKAPAGRAAAVMPKGVFAEPYYSFVLALYPSD